MEHAEHTDHPAATPHAEHAITAGLRNAARQDGSANRWTTVGDTSERLGVSRWSVIRAFHNGLIPGIKFGTTYKLLAAFVDELVALVHAGHGVDFEEFAAQWVAKAKEMAS